MNVEAHILTALRTRTEGVSGAELAQQLGVTRAAIWARIEELRGLGYDIEASPHRGYRLLSAPDVLHADDLRSRLGAVRIIGRDIRVFLETTSTNDIIERLARDGVREGVVVFAESQTRGRGRLGRRWISPARRGIWCSVLLRPAMRPQAVTRITVAAAWALVRALCAVTDLSPEVKWPNDVLLGGRKVAGILTEMSAELDRVKHVTLGLGVNVNQTTAEFPPELRGLATSVRVAAGQPLDRAELAVAILRELENAYGCVRSDQFESVADEWEACCSTLGQTVVVQVGERRVRGRAESLDPDGALLLRTEHGHLERITGGDVTVEK